MNFISSYFYFILILNAQILSYASYFDGITLGFCVVRVKKHFVNQNFDSTMTYRFKQQILDSPYLK